MTKYLRSFKGGGAGLSGVSVLNGSGMCGSGMIECLHYGRCLQILYHEDAMDVHAVLRKLHRVRIFRVDELATWLRCSVPTARRRLREWDAHTSINCNGAYYTLADVPRFDNTGLWWCRQALFSRHGNLRETVCSLVAAAPAGLTSGELSAVLGMQARAFLSHFRAEPSVCRVRLGRGNLWLSSDPGLHDRQLTVRRGACHTHDSFPSDAEAVPVLVELIRHPGSDVEDLARLLNARGTPVSAARIRCLLEHHQLRKGGAADSAPCAC